MFKKFGNLTSSLKFKITFALLGAAFLVLSMTSYQVYFHGSEIIEKIFYEKLRTDVDVTTKHLGKRVKAEVDQIRLLSDSVRIRRFFRAYYRYYEQFHDNLVDNSCHDRSKADRFHDICHSINYSTKNCSGDEGKCHFTMKQLLDRQVMIHSVLEEIRQQFDLEDIGLYDNKLNAIYSSNNLFSYGQRYYLLGFENNSSFEIIRDFDLDDHGIMVSEVNESDDDIKFSILAPVFIENEKVGFVNFKLLPRRLEDYFASGQIVENDIKTQNRTFLTNSDGKILASNRGNHVYGNTHWLFEDPDNSHFFHQQKDIFDTRFFHDDDEYLVSASKLDAFGVTWWVLAETKQKDAVGEFSVLVDRLIYTAVGLFVAFVGISVAISNRFLIPINDLVSAMIAFKNGERNVRVKIKSNTAEIGVATEAFNSLAQTVVDTTVSESEMQDIFNSMLNGILVISLENGVMELKNINETAGVIIGADETTRVEKMIERIPPVLCETHCGLSGKEWLKVVTKTGFIRPHEIKITGLDDVARDIVFACRARRIGENKSISLLISMTDITELKNTQQYNESMKELFGKFVPEDVASSMIANPNLAAIEGKMQEITVVATDLKGFTALSNYYDPKYLFDILNDYLSSMYGVVSEWGGNIIEVMGDGLFVIFRNLTDGDDHTDRAIACAIELQNKLVKLNRDLVRANRPPLKMGIGIHRGTAMLGNIGSDKRMKFSAMGAPVNTAFRIESLATNGDILMTDFTCKKARNSKIETGRKFTANLKGLDPDIQIVAVVGSNYKGEHFLSQRSHMPEKLDRDRPILIQLVDHKEVLKEEIAAIITHEDADQAVIATSLVLKIGQSLKVVDAVLSASFYVQVLSDEVSSLAQGNHTNSKPQKGYLVVKSSIIQAKKVS